MSSSLSRFVPGRRALVVCGALLALQLAALFIHLVAFPMPPPDPRTFPRAGDRFASRVEGFSQEILGVDEDGRVAMRLVIAPGAGGPPRHRHDAFTERFTVKEGTLTLEVDGRVIDIAAGQSHEIPAGVPHRPFNPGSTPVVVEGEGAMPVGFAACLVQIYKIMDGEPEARGRSMALQTAVHDARCDTHLDAVPPGAEQAMKLLVGPWARVAGYRAWYPELSLHP